MKARHQSPVPEPVPRLCEGGTVACFATGPSLTAADVNYCRGRCDAAIAINDAWRLAPWADALVASDGRWWQFYKGVPEFAGRKYCLEGSAHHLGVSVLLMTGQTGIETKPTAVRSGMNSGAAAINVAVHFGARRIVLLGYDMAPQDDGKRRRMHFFGDHPAALQRTPPFEVFLRAFDAMRAPLKALGVEVLNASRQTKLKAFPRVALEDAFPAGVRRAS